MDTHCRADPHLLRQSSSIYVIWPGPLGWMWFLPDSGSLARHASALHHPRRRWRGWPDAYGPWMPTRAERWVPFNSSPWASGDRNARAGRARTALVRARPQHTTGLRAMAAPARSSPVAGGESGRSTLGMRGGARLAGQGPPDRDGPVGRLPSDSVLWIEREFCSLLVGLFEPCLPAFCLALVNGGFDLVKVFYAFAGHFDIACG